MRLKRIQNDFRVFEVLDEDLLGPGPCTLYRVTKRGLTTLEAAAVLAGLAGVPKEAVSFAGLKDKDGVTGQFMSVEGGRRVNHDEGRLTIRPVGPAQRPLTSADNQANSFEVVVRDLRAEDMKRLRIHLAAVRRLGLPAYFDDQRFGCLRHGQGFIVRHLLRGDPEAALKALLTAPSRFGPEAVEQYKERIARAWGDWGRLAEQSRGRRGHSVFLWLQEHPGDFEGALVRGISTAERTIHLFAYQSHLWNRAASLLLRERVPAERLGWLPGDDGALPVPYELTEEELAELRERRLPLLGPGVVLGDEDLRYYQAVFQAEGFPMERFLELDLSGFRPQGELRDLWMFPSFLRAAPAQPDEIYKRRHKMRVRFTLPRGRYATLVLKRLLMPTAAGGSPLHVWVSRHRMDYPGPDGKRRPREEHRPRRGSAREGPGGRGGGKGGGKPGRRGPGRGGKPSWKKERGAGPGRGRGAGKGAGSGKVRGQGRGPGQGPKPGRRAAGGGRATPFGRPPASGRDATASED